jgi:hypothetical protein
MKVVDFEEFNNFVLVIFHLKSFIQGNYVWSSNIWKLKFSNDLGWRSAKTKGIVLDDINKFVVENVFIWIR